MDPNLVERIANAVLYEGYLLYPYRRSAIKNRHRFNFGVVYPQDYGMAHNEPFCMQTECLAAGDGRMALDVRVRFLHLTAREGWQVGVERELNAPALGIDDLLASPRQMSFVFHQNGRNGRVKRPGRKRSMGILKSPLTDARREY